MVSVVARAAPASSRGGRGRQSLCSEKKKRGKPLVGNVIRNLSVVLIFTLFQAFIKLVDYLENDSIVPETEKIVTTVTTTTDP